MILRSDGNIFLQLLNLNLYYFLNKFEIEFYQRFLHLLKYYPHLTIQIKT